jgi:4-hydroxy-tetrahydrodipicolinate synthase
MFTGCYTAIVTPFEGDAVDYKGLDQLVEFQIANGISGILAVGTTGESPVLDWKEHNVVVENIARATTGKCTCIAGTGSNNTKEALGAAEHALHAGADAVLLVDPYYNGPSSLEIRREYVAPIASALSTVPVIPYVIPGRTGAQLLPEDLAILSRDFENVQTVKEATGNLENMKRTRACCGPDFSILSGDDAMTFSMMTDPEIAAAGVISVASNVVPKAVADMVRLLREGNVADAQKLEAALAPFFGLVTVKTIESTPFGDVVCRARNPLALKTLMGILGMPSGGCRPPLGKMSRNGLNVVVAALKKMHAENPELLQPIESFFHVNIESRINDRALLDPLCYESY